MCVSQHKPIVLVCHNMASRVGTKKEGDGGAKRSLAQQTPGLMTALIAGQISLLSRSLTQIQNTQIQEYTNTKVR